MKERVGEMGRANERNERLRTLEQQEGADFVEEHGLLFACCNHSPLTQLQPAHHSPLPRCRPST